MSMTTRRLAAGSVLGLAAAAALCLVGCAALVYGVAHGAPGWVLDTYLVLGATLLTLYVLLCFLPQRRSAHLLAKAEEDASSLMKALAASLEEIRQGDLAGLQSADSPLPDELQAAFRAAVESLTALIQQIQNSSTEVAAAGELVQQTAADLASGSSEQAAGVVEITATMEELARTAAQIARNAASQAELAAQAEKSGDAGAAAVAEALAGVEAVQRRIADVATRADGLGSRSKEIYRVLDLITEIAHETHILSLNAAIEAAAGGESGRRFGVVADEVRRLAQRSRESVESVRTLLDEFAGSIRMSVVATEEAGKETTRVLERSRSAAGSIAELRGALSNTARAAREISLATEEQRTASDQVVLTLREVSQVIQRMAEGLKNFKGAAEKVEKLALSIQLLTQSFHLDSPRSLKHLGERWANGLAAHAGHWEAAEGWLAGAVREAPSIELAYLVDRSGNMVAFALGVEAGEGREVPPNVTIGANFSDRPWFQSAMREGDTILTPLYESILTGERCFTVAAPVRDRNHAVVAVLGLDVNARSWTKI